MKKKIILIITILCFIISPFHAQTNPNWQTIYPGFFLNGGELKFVVTKNCLYNFNGTLSNLLRSVDRGVKWDSLQVPSDEHEHEYFDITFVNDSVGYVVGIDGDHHSQFKSVIKKTTDRGLTWKTTVPQLINPTAFSHVNFFTADTGMVLGHGTGISERYRTVDGGLNWTYLPNTAHKTSLIHDSWFKGKDAVLTGFTNFLILEVTHDYGSTWIEKEFPGIEPATGLKFFDSQNGVVVAGDTIYFTTDGANSFSSKIKFPFSRIVKFDMLDMKRGFFSTIQSIYYTEDAGKNWTLSYTNSNAILANLKIQGKNVFVTTAHDRFILKLDISDLVSGLHETKSQQNNIQIYPNPATNHIYIGNPGNEKLFSVTITDQLGRVVRKQSLEETKSIDLIGLKSGIYIFEIKSKTETYIHKVIVNEIK